MKQREVPLGRGVLYRVYQRRLKNWLADKDLPRHVAMIVDGNRRWAKIKAGQPAAYGHRAGAAKIHEFLQWCDDLNIDVVTLYVLSADNLTGRPTAELNELFRILAELAHSLSQQGNWRVQHVGRTEGLPAPLADALVAAEDCTKDNTGLHVNLAVGYGGRREIADAMRSILRSHGKEGGTLEELAELLTPDLIADHLYTGGQPDPDLVIRTSGEQRISDFMLWQSAHSEFYFVEALYPDLREVDFLRAVRDYARRHRRFGS
ncbi:MAG: isoprenyl transferase [Glaciihabitans sp.]|nr:isoprenyl transferase [Glaciihabitans sp.]